MPSQIPVHINPYDCAKRGTSFNGSLPQALFKRVQESGVGQQTPANFSVELNFTQDQANERWLSGYIKGKIMLTCQRCLHPLTYNLQLSLKHILCPTYQHLARHKKVDTVFAKEDEKIRVVDLIEDDILLALPTIAKHQKITNCKELEAYLPTSDQAHKTTAKKNNPFAVLKDKINL